MFLRAFWLIENFIKSRRLNFGHNQITEAGCFWYFPHYNIIIKTFISNTDHVILDHRSNLDYWRCLAFRSFPLQSNWPSLAGGRYGPSNCGHRLTLNNKHHFLHRVHLHLHQIQASSTRNKKGTLQKPKSKTLHSVHCMRLLLHLWHAAKYVFAVLSIRWSSIFIHR